MVRHLNAIRVYRALMLSFTEMVGFMKVRILNARVLRNLIADM